MVLFFQVDELLKCYDEFQQNEGSGYFIIVESETCVKIYTIRDVISFPPESKVK